jgi:hypothetical protein
MNEDITENALYQAHHLLMSEELLDKKYSNVSINASISCHSPTEEELANFLFGEQDDNE